jgi:formate--tetrahydrofolate ligase
VGFNADGRPVIASDLKAVGPLMVLLNDALAPNLVQTTEGVPAIVHGGPFANIAHGTSSVLAQRVGLHLADYVVNETGFAADLGAEKFFDLVMQMSGHVPAAAVVIVTLKALRAQGGSLDGPAHAGFPNLDRHLANIRRWGTPPVVALNRFAADSDADLQSVLDHCRTQGVDAALSEGYLKGGDGMTDLADRVVAASARSSPDQVQPIYTAAMPLEEKIATIATQVYGASGVAFKPAAKARLQRLSSLGYQRLPVCIAKTQYSFSDDPTVMGAPTGWTLTISDVTLSAGAGFVVAIAGSMMLMPGLGKAPQAQKLDVDETGHVTGMDY